MSILVKKVQDMVVTPCLEEEEPYAIRSRKLAVIAVAMVASNAIVLGIPLIVLLVLNAPTASNICIGIALIYPSVTSGIVPYGYLRHTKTLPDWLVDLQMWSLAPTTLAFSLYVHHSATAVLCACIALISIIMRIRFWPLMLMYIVALNGLHSLITDYPEELPALYDTFKVTHSVPIRVMALVGVNMSPLLVVGLGLYAIMKEFVERSDQADAAIAMNLAVADKLRRYDTDGVALILAANKGKVDENLLEAFTAIQHNLQEYRPHIPDYVIAATLSTEGGEEETEGSVADDGENSIQADLVECTSAWSGKQSAGVHTPDSTQHPRTSSSQVCSRRQSMDTPGAYKSMDTTNEDVSTSASVTSTGTTTMNAPTSHSKFEDPTSSAIVSEALRNSLHPNEHSTFMNKYDELHTFMKHKQHYYGKVTTVFVRFVSEACGSDGSGNGSVPKSSNVAAMMALSRCVEAASKLAKLFHGALQYMQGCGLMVSFNATSRVATHEAKACAFADALRLEVDGMRSTSPVVMHASVVTSPNVLSFFAGNSGQLMLTVLGGFMPQHTAMHHYLSQTVGMVASCVLLTDHVVSTVDMTYETRRLGAIAFNPVHDIPATPYILSQLLGHRSHTDIGEWMYNIQSVSAKDSTTTVTLTNCLVDIAIGGGEIPQVPEDVIALGIVDVVLDRCVLSRLGECSPTRSKQQFTLPYTTPTIMW